MHQTVSLHMVWLNLLCKVALTTAIPARGMAYMLAYLTCRDMPTGGIGTGSSTWESFATMAPPLQLHHVAATQPSCTSLTAEKSENALTGLLLAGRCSLREARLQKPVANIAESADLVQSTALGDRDPAKKRRHQVVISVTRLHQPSADKLADNEMMGPH